MQSIFRTFHGPRLAACMAALCLGLGAGSAQAQVANTPAIAEALPGLGVELSPAMVSGTFKLYGPLHAQASEEGLTITKDQAYGPHERHRLDVYAPEGISDAPVLVFVHGGGFVRGDKAGAANIGRYFASQGVVTLPINYRFAPENTWPSGADDLRAVLEWVRGNIAAFGGNPDKVILMGNSAGSMHVADYTFREELQAENDGVIGAVLISTPTVDLNAREIDPKRDALYYGTEGDRSAQSVINALDGRKIPVMVGYAQHEPAVILDQTTRLVQGLTARDGHLPLVAGVAGHNHISIVEHIGTADQSLSREILNFIGTQAMASN
jgi:acetyl esterase/lipase